MNPSILELKIPKKFIIIDLIINAIVSKRWYMSFFNFKKKVEKKEFQPKVVLTENVNKELLKVAKEYDLPISSLDFRLLSYKTYIKFPDTEFLEADKEGLEKFMIKENLLNEDSKIKQIYEIEIIKFKSSNNFELLGKMAVNSNYTKAEFLVSKNSIFKINNIYEKVKEELNKKKIKNSLLINFFDLMDEDIRNLQNIIFIDGKLNNDLRINICKGIEPVKTVNGKIIYHFNIYKSKEKKLIYPVKEGETLIEIILPKEGQNGRDCKGEIIKIQKSKEFNIPNIEFDEKTIEKKINDERILFISKKNGYIIKEDGKFIIKDEMEIKQINIKTGNVENADKSDVKLKIKENDVLKEAIADNMMVETTELYVKGNVGNKAKIKAKKLEINGQTHKNSKILTEDAFINVHKGEVKAKKIKINRLESGIVRADEVEIDLALGGIVYAKSIKINKLLSHNKFFASNLIQICEVKGEENIFAISPKKVLKDIDIEAMGKKITQIEQNLNIKKREYNRLKKIYLENKNSIGEYKKLYLQNKQNNKKTSPIILKKLKEFKILTDKINNFKIEILMLKKQKEHIKEEIEYLQNGIYKAKIISNSNWKPFNRIMFELIEPPIKLIYDTKTGDYKCGFKLKSEDELKIIKIKVKDDICD